MSNSYRLVPLLGAALLCVLLSACGSGDTTDAGSSSNTTEETAGEGAVEVVEVYNGFEYYGACGNERLSTGTTTYYPLLPEEVADIDKARYPADLTETTEEGFAAIQRVADPGPGDDVGLLLVYADGLARFESDSGWIIWLTDVERTYEWDC